MANKKNHNSFTHKVAGGKKHHERDMQHAEKVRQRMNN